MVHRDTLGHFEQLLLMVLIRLRNNAYGVPIREKLIEARGKDIGVGAVYTALGRLEEKGFVSSSVGEPTGERGGRAKKYYEITASGQEILSHTLTVQQRLQQLPQGGILV